MHAPGLRMITAGIAVLAINGLAEAGPNELTTLPLHAVIQPASPPPCNIDDPCAPGPPTTTVPPGTEIAIYLLARNFDNLGGVQTAFDWGGWSLVSGSWNCQGTQVSGTEPHGAGGSSAGTIATAFDCVLGPSTAIIGSMTFVTTSAGCLTQVESAFPFGTHVVSCNAAMDPVALYNCGAVCVGASGVDACETLIAVEPICDAGGPYITQVGQPILFDGTGSYDPDGSIVSYAWSFGDGWSGSGATTTHSYQTAGVYSVTLCVTDNHAIESCCHTEAFVEHAPEPPICDAGGPYGAPEGEPVLFDGTGSIPWSGHTIVSYAWEFGDGDTGSGPTTTHVYATNGTYLATLTVEDDHGLSSNCGTTVSINALPICDAGGPYADYICTAITFDGRGSTDPDGTIVAYAWAFGDGQSGAGATTTHVYFDGGIFTVTLTVTDDAGGASSCATTAVIDDVGAPDPLTPVIGVDPPQLDFEYFPLSRCLEFSIALWNDVTDPCSGLVIEELSISGADFSLVDPPPTPFAIPGDASVIDLTVRCCPSVLGVVSGTLTITASEAVNSPVVVPLSVEGNLLPHCNTNGPYTAGVGEEITFDGSGSNDPNGDITSYAWEFGDGDTGAGAVVTHAYGYVGSFLVTLCVTDDQGGESCCETSAYTGQVVRGAWESPGQLVLRPCWPNPFNPSTTITFELPTATHVTLRIYDSAGRQVRNLLDRELAGGVRAVPWDGRNDGGQSMGSGIYIYRLEAGGKMLQRKMVLVR